MTDSEKREFLSPDKPVTDPDTQDRLGYAPFAKHLADSIMKMAPPEGLVIAIYGPWGSGKSSVLEFIIHYLEDENEKPVIVRFNPWWFSGQEALTLHFFSQLSASLASSLQNIKDELVKQIGNLGEVISKTPIPGAELGELVKNWSDPDHDVIEQKKRIAALLGGQERRILVVIDDIDRLTAEEIRQLFLLIKAVADFPNVIYLLAFDKDVVTNALENTQTKGDLYLDKIVQVPFELPYPDQTLLSTLLIEKLNQIFQGTPDYLSDSVDFGNIYHDLVIKLIATPRDVNRLANTLSVTYPAVLGEVNLADFMGIESLRVFRPAIYRIVKENKDMFAGRVSEYYIASEHDRLREFHKSWLAAYDEADQQEITRMLVRLFPKLDNITRLGATIHTYDYEKLWRRELRICSSFMFDTYFRLSVPTGGISTLEVTSILGLTDNLPSFCEKLVELARQIQPNGVSRVKVFLERLLDYVDTQIKESQISSIVQAIYLVGDKLIRPDDERALIPFDGNETSMWRITWRLLLRLHEEERYRILYQAIEKGISVSIITDQVYELGSEHGKYGEKEPRPEENRLVNEEHLRDIEICALAKLREFAENGTIFNTWRLRTTLALWKDISDQAEVSKWVKNAISNDTDLLKLVEGFLSRLPSYTFGDAVTRTQYRLNPKWLEQYVEPIEIIKRLKDIPADVKLSENQRVAVERFTHEYEIIAGGGDPDDERFRD